jgi:hypothetical protein
VFFFSFLDISRSFDFTSVGDDYVFSRQEPAEVSSCQIRTGVSACFYSIYLFLEKLSGGDVYFLDRQVVQVFIV